MKTHRKKETNIGGRNKGKQERWEKGNKELKEGGRR